MSKRTREHIRRRFMSLSPAFWATVVTMLCLGITTLFLYVGTNIVTITSSDGDTSTVFAQTLDKRALVTQIADMRCSEDDVITYEQDKHGYARLHVEYSFPVNISADGNTISENLIECTVSDALAALNITLEGDDYTEPALHAKITRENNNIAVHRVTYNYYTINEVVPYETEYQYTSLFYRSQNRQMLIQEGVDGLTNAKLCDKLIDGEVVETTTVEDYGSTEAVPEILKVYKAGAEISSIKAPDGLSLDANGIPTSYKQVYTMKATGYYSPRGKGSSGLGLYYGTFAVDPTVIPYGTMCYIVSTNGKFIYGWAIPTDTGLFTQTNQMQVDLFYETYAESAINGVQEVNVYVIG